MIYIDFKAGGFSMSRMPQTPSALNEAGEKKSQEFLYIPVCNIPIYLGGKAGTERIAIYRTASGSGQMAELQRKAPDDGPWIVEFSSRFDAPGSSAITVLSGYCEEIGSQVSVLYTVRGVEGFLSYKVLARRKNRIVILAERKDIYQGGIWFDGGKLIEAQGNRYRMWAFMRGRLYLVPYQLPKVPGAVQVRYSIETDGRIKLSSRYVTVPVGAAVQIRRADRNAIDEMVHFNSSLYIKLVEHRSTFRFTATGKLVFRIMPRGYGKERFAELIVEARER